ncbi:hypothetical protein [Streptomyces sp. NPDC053560]|uniref:hypothetical protein n=1 Tax=Streptomyces sp. NPDC053560 TaxID=3365711 RepID=UPI0037D7DFDD
MPLPHTRRPALALPLLLAGACALPAAPAPSHEDRPPPTPTQQVRSLVLPFDAYQLSLAEYYTLSAARDRLIRTCLGRLGGEWPVIDRPARAVDWKNRRRYGVIETDVAARFGYHAPQNLLSPYPAVVQREEQREAALSPRARKAALDPRHGCALTADRQLLRGGDADERKLHTLDATAFKQSRSDPSVKKAQQAWRTCMREEHHPYTSPEAAVNDARWWKEDTAAGASEETNNTSADASGEEIATAKADVRCKQRTAFARTWFTAEKTLQEKSVREHAHYFHGLKTAKLRQLRTARAVLKAEGARG